MGTERALWTGHSLIRLGLPLGRRHVMLFTGICCAPIGCISRPADADQWPENSVFPVNRDWSSPGEDWRVAYVRSWSTGKRPTPCSDLLYYKIPLMTSWVTSLEGYVQRYLN